MPIRLRNARRFDAQARMKIVLLAALMLSRGAAPAAGQDAGDRTRDRGTGVPTSMFGTYIDKGEWLIYPFFEYYRDGNYEYEAGELGFAGTTELRGRYRAHEGLIFVGYGVSDRLAIEFEAAMIDASLDKSPLDTSAMPARLTESGLGDVEAQVRWRWRKETATRPEVFSYFETVFPFQRSKPLTGTSDVRTTGFSWKSELPAERPAPRVIPRGRQCSQSPEPRPCGRVRVAQHWTCRWFYRRTDSSPHFGRAAGGARQPPIAYAPRRRDNRAAHRQQPWTDPRRAAG